MEIILLERVGSLGTIGDVVTVKDGYARNFLLPNKKALRANDANRKVFEATRAQIEKDNEQRRGVAEQEASKLDGVSVELIRQASNTGQLYGSVSVRDIVVALADKGEKVTKQQIILERPIKAIGVHKVRVQLHAEVELTVKVNVARSPEEAELQAQGVDVMAAMFEKDEAGFTEAFDPDAEPGQIAAIEGEGEAETAVPDAAEEAASEPAAEKFTAEPEAAESVEEDETGEDSEPTA
ncbi:MAG: 50S ribosomal protein L9 [Sphingomonadaceae bacterium]|nr:50S ribosomal protein L9 [Sphingomonadaceae bacterium]